MRLRKEIFIILILMILMFVGCKRESHIIPEETPEESNIELPEDQEDIMIKDEIEEKIQSMSLEEKIGQLMIIGFNGIELNEEILKSIDELHVGGFILFGRNIVDEYQTLKLLNQIKEANGNGIPLFLSIDEEGGIVSRLPKSYVKLPDSMVVGDKNDRKISYELGNILGKRVQSLGFNIDFAPVLDINSNPKNPVIGKRAFGTTVEQVVNNGIEVMKGIRDMGVIPAVKHFPGHGDTSMDSHVNLPKVDKSIEELRRFELVPFVAAIEEKVDIVMIAHILYPNIDSKYPATMSSTIIGEVLRGELGYEGVVISDDMTMGAIIENYELEEGVVSFLKAGGDIALVCHGKDNPRKVLDKIKNAVNLGIFSEEEIDQKVYRILELKSRYRLEDKVIDSIDIKALNHETKGLINRIKK